MSSTLGNTSPVAPADVEERAGNVENGHQMPAADQASRPERVARAEHVARVHGSDPCEGLRIAVLLPCRNEAAAIGNVVRAFRASLPNADVYVYDNASTDDTAEIARRAGAIVRRAPQPGKGNVVRRMFAEIDADVYVLADGDDTYEADAAPRLIAELRNHSLDMVVGRRIEGPDAAASYRPGHRFGNQVLTGVVRRLFGATCNDMLSGYRVFSRRYVKSFPAFSKGFETETEMTVHALDLMMPIREVDTDYRVRPEESSSKLRTVRDGVKILRFIVRLFKEYEPIRFFGTLALMSGILSGLFAARGSDFLPVRLSGQLAIALAGLGVVLASAGLILDTVSRSRREMKRIMYLALPYGPGQVGPAGLASNPRSNALHNGTGGDWASVRRRMGA